MQTFRAVIFTAIKAQSTWHNISSHIGSKCWQYAWNGCRKRVVLAVQVYHRCWASALGKLDTGAAGGKRYRQPVVRLSGAGEGEGGTGLKEVGPGGGRGLQGGLGQSLLPNPESLPGPQKPAPGPLERYSTLTQGDRQLLPWPDRLQ